VKNLTFYKFVAVSRRLQVISTKSCSKRDWTAAVDKLLRSDHSEKTMYDTLRYDVLTCMRSEADECLAGLIYRTE